MQSGEYAWHIVLCEPNRETVGVSGLIGRGIKAYLPQIKKDQKPRRGVARSVLLPMFRGYAFVLTCPSDTTWTRIYTTPGLRGPLILGTMLATVTEPQLNAIMDKESELLNFKPVKNELKPGDTVRMVDGPFAGQLVNVHALDDAGRITILMNLFGRTTKGVVAQNQIERVRSF